MKPNLKNIPTDPGVYQYYDKAGARIYIGKAKNLRNRVASYWTKGSELSPAKQEMVREVSRVDTIVVNNESEALLLEAGLIKKHTPKYNIDLRDDKSWRYIVITQEAFPRIITVHGSKKVRGEYFGPFTRASDAKTLIRLLHQILPLRTCKRDLSKLPNGLVCMQYHLGNCLGPCEKLIDSTEYGRMIAQARDILKGNTKEMLRQLELDMRTSSQNQEYEQAAVYRNRLRALRALSIRQDMVHPLLRDLDVIAIASGPQTAVVTVMQLRGGHMLDTLHYVIRNALALGREEILEHYLARQYGSVPSRRTLVLPLRVSKTVERALRGVRIVYPKRGVKNRLVKLAEKNAWLYYGKQTKTESVPSVLHELQTKLGLPALPLRIEAYDISNISGVYAVGAMVVAQNGKLTPSQYRKFKIKTVSGPNDVAMMREMLMRRQNHPEWQDPDLIVLDGGKPQLSTVYPILKAAWKPKIVALAKREEELFIPGRRFSIRLSQRDPGLLLLRKIRDAVHNQAVRYYRKVHTTRWKD